MVGALGRVMGICAGGCLNSPHLGAFGHFYDFRLMNLGALRALIHREGLAMRLLGGCCRSRLSRKVGAWGREFHQGWVPRVALQISVGVRGRGLWV